ncbi:hypothetical protein OSB04_002962 [Centaurea solstitialis]|uniref:Reverse transcriptase Ty1/copia-type domain-containing protein n=1 Tax=Centaurea solstitialis TaxID=347529 RepID=A0AA38U4E8_9ASTR|nr:hypothetical protein OSB04_002962 [Centaurea solstitialis]
MKNAQSQHRRHLAIAKSHIWRRQVRLNCRLGLILVSGVAKMAVWRSQDGAWSFFFKYQPPPSVLNMSFEVRYTRGIQRNESESTKGADTLQKSISDHLSLYCRYSHNSKAYRVFNKRTRTILESSNVDFSETETYSVASPSNVDASFPELFTAPPSTDSSTNSFALDFIDLADYDLPTLTGPIVVSAHAGSTTTSVTSDAFVTEPSSSTSTNSVTPESAVSPPETLSAASPEPVREQTPHPVLAPIPEEAPLPSPGSAQRTYAQVVHEPRQHRRLIGKQDHLVEASKRSLQCKMRTTPPTTKKPMSLFLTLESGQEITPSPPKSSGVPHNLSRRDLQRTLGFSDARRACGIREKQSMAFSDQTVGKVNNRPGVDIPEQKRRERPHHPEQGSIGRQRLSPCAFLNGVLQEEVYIEQPEGFVDPRYPNHVYVLDKALYGLKQAPRAWYEILTDYLLGVGYKKGTIDPTLFLRRSGSDLIIVQIYVDDIIFASTKPEMCQEFENTMKSQFKMSMMGELTFFLGLQKTYWAIIGSLFYLMASRPDIVFSTGVCARFQCDPRDSHLSAVKRILRYLKGTPDFGLWYPKDSGFELIAYTDSDHAGCKLNRKITSGACQFLGDKLRIPIYCDSKSAIQITVNPVQHSRTKHIDIRYHFIKDHVEKGNVELYFVESDYQLVDLFTKPFDEKRHFFLLSKLGMLDLPA